MIPLIQDLVTHYRVTHVLWHQGESDFALRTDPVRYKEEFLSFADTLRANAVDAKIFVSTATRCLPGWSEPNAIQAAQHQLAADGPRLRGRASTPTSSCRLRIATMTVTWPDSGEVKTARAWTALLARHP